MSTQLGYKIILLDCPNPFNAVIRAEFFEEIVQGVPAVSIFVVKCSGGPSGILECRFARSTMEIYLGVALSPDTSITPLGTGLDNNR